MERMILNIEGIEPAALLAMQKGILPRVRFIDEENLEKSITKPEHVTAAVMANHMWEHLKAIAEHAAETTTKPQLNYD